MADKKQTQILLINDMAGYGKVALSVMIPVLSHLKFETFNLPTALVSNTLDYGQFDILDTTEYMENTLLVWKKLMFSFDAICTGFIVSERQSSLVYEYCKEQQKSGTSIFVDPIMGDEGTLYNGVTEQTVAHMKKLVGVADYIVPNYTEAARLTGVEYHESATISEVDEMIQRLGNMGAKSVIITSIQQDGKDVVAGFDHKTKQRFTIPFYNIPVRFPGTGDIFSSVLLGKLMEGNSLYDSTKKPWTL